MVKLKNPNPKSHPLDHQPIMTDQNSELDQLNLAQKLVEDNPAQYPQIVQGILPFIDRPDIRVRQWCAQFLLGAFSCSAISIDVKSALAVVCLDPVLKMLQNNTDPYLLKNIICCSATMYSLLFRYIAMNDQETDTWNKTLDLKSRILRLWNDEDTHFTVETACIKFAQEVISCQTYGSPDSRLSGPTEYISLSNVPDGHPLLDSTLEAQALGLLDRLLSVFSEPSLFAPRITITINALSPLIRSRPNTVTKIIRSVLSFDSSTKHTSSSASETRIDLEYKSVDRCLHLFLDSILDLEIAPKFYGQIKKYLSTMSQTRASERLKKRIDQSEDHSPASKRIKLNDSIMPPNTSTSVPTGPYSFTTLFNLLRSDDQLASFDAKELPSEIAINIAMIGISRVNQQLLQNSINIVSQRYKNLVEQAPFTQASQSKYFPLESYGDETSFEPVEAVDEPIDAYEDAEDDQYALMPSASFSLPNPSRLTDGERMFQANQVLNRLISYSSTSNSIVSTGAAKANKGIDRVAISEWTTDTWILIAARTVTRGMCQESPLAETIREGIFNYAMENFRDRLEVIVTWLTEEWYSDQMRDKGDESIYFKWASKILDQIVPLIDKNDTKGWLRLLSDLPELNKSLIWKIRSLCMDPDRSQLGIMSLRYCIMFKPPVKKDCIELLEYLYKNDSTSKVGAETLLKKFKPEVVEGETVAG